MRDHAIVVGINDYRPLPALRGAINDARGFEWWLRDPMGGHVPAENIHFIASEPTAPGTRPTQQHVEDAMLAHIARYRENKERQRRLYIFLSGHGIVTGYGDLERCRILMADASLDAIARNIGVQTAGVLLQRTPLFEEIVLFADSCRTLYANPFAVNELTIRRAVIDLVDQAKGLNVPMMWGFATTWGDTIHETDLPACDGTDEYCTRGRFTYALVAGLRRAVDADGNVTLASLREYVDELMNRLDSAQTPDFGGDPIVLARPSSIPNTRVVIRLLAPTASLEIRGAAGPRVISLPDNTDTVALDLCHGRYTFVAPGRIDKQVAVIGEEVHAEL